MKDYWLHINFAVQAKDDEEAIEIGEAIIEAAKKGPYKIEGAEVDEVEEA